MIGCIADLPSDDVRRDRFDAVFGEHYGTVRAFLLRRTDRGAVDDALAETFLVAWRRIDAVPADALPWLLGVARRVLANQRRAEARRGALVARLRALIPRPNDGERHGDVDGALRAALASLSEREREALLLVAWEGLEPVRAAQVVGCSPATFRARLHRARRHLATRLDPPAPATTTTQALGETR